LFHTSNTQDTHQAKHYNPKHYNPPCSSSCPFCSYFPPLSLEIGKSYFPQSDTQVFVVVVVAVAAVVQWALARMLAAHNLGLVAAGVVRWALAHTLTAHIQDLEAAADVVQRASPHKLVAHNLGLVAQDGRHLGRVVTTAVYSNS
jgi:hypothetical protein